LAVSGLTGGGACPEVFRVGVRAAKKRATIFAMAAINSGSYAKPEGNPAKHFGKQMRKERLARGWTLREFAARSGINYTTASLIENGKRPPNERAAAACDKVFPERKNWFTEYYAELQEWSEVPAAFKDWTEREDSSAVLRVWSPSIVHGTLQTEDYARALLRTYPGVSEDVVAARLAARMARQQRLFSRDVLVWFIVDELSLFRLVGSHAVMAGQMRRLAEVAALPNVTLQILPPVGNPVTGSEIILADDSVYAEHAASGFVYTGETVNALDRLFDTLRAECHKASESLALLERTREAWATTGARAAIPEPTAGVA
jgi:transcriptional regulator with XRE-family HTH domain